MKRGWAVVLLVVAVLWFICRKNETRLGGNESTGVSLNDEPIGKDAPLPGVKLIERNPFIEDYGKKEGGDLADLQALRDVVTDCQLLLKDFDRYHLPGNPEITRFLQGFNPEKLAWIPAKHDSINAAGELLDRHGTPVFFHRLSGMRFEFRSAGLDRKHWTNDDVIVR